MADNIIKTYTIQIDTKNGEIQVKGLTKGFVEQSKAVSALQKKIDELNESIDENASGLKNNIDKTGLAGAAAVELGRTISDANYGFTAMANNISQLSTLMVTLVATSGGVKKGIGELIKVMKGPIGFIVLFQIGVAIMEMFAIKSKEAGESTKDLTKQLGANVVVARKYVDILEDVNTSENKRATVIKELKKLVPTLRDEDFKYGEQLDIVRKKIIDYSITQASRIEIDKLTADNSALLAKKGRLDTINAIKDEEEKVKAIKELLNEEGISLRTYNKEKIAISKQGNIIYTEERLKTIEELKNDLKTLTQDVDEESKPLLEKLEKLTKGFDFGFSDTPEGKQRREKRIKLFKEQILDFKSEEQKFRNEALKSEAIYEEDKIEIRRIAALKDLEIKYEDFETSQSLRLKQYLFQLDLDKKSELAKAKTQEQKQEIEKRYYDASIDGINSYNQSLVDANSNYLRAIDSANKSFSSQTKNFYEQQQLSDLQGLVKQLQIGSDLVKQFDIDMATNELDRIASEDALREQQFLREKLRLEKTIKLNKERNLSTLEDEEKLTNLKIKYKQDEDKSFEKSEKAKLAIANQVGQAIIGIAGEGSAIGKAVAVAMAIMNTKEAITAALGAKPYGPWNIAQAVATGVFGMQQVREIMATKLPVGDTGGGGAASVSVAAPDFNVVGQGAGSQLAGVVGARFGEPIKAYVLSSDVTSAQEMDRKIDSTATIG